MGHTNEETSLIYTEVQLNAKRQAMEQLEEFLFGSKIEAYRTQRDPSCSPGGNISTLTS